MVDFTKLGATTVNTNKNLGVKILIIIPRKSNFNIRSIHTNTIYV